MFDFLKEQLSHLFAYFSTQTAVDPRFVRLRQVVNSGATAMEKGRGVLRDVELGLRRAQQRLGGQLFGGDFLKVKIAKARLLKRIFVILECFVLVTLKKQVIKTWRDERTPKWNW